MASVSGRDQLRGDPNAIARPAHTALENIRYIHGLGDTPDIFVFALERKSRRPGDHFQPGNTGKQVDNLLSQTVAEVLVLLVRAQIGKRENSDRRLLPVGSRQP